VRLYVPYLAVGALLTPDSPLAAQGPRAAAGTIAQTVDSLASRAVAAGLTPALGVAVTMDGRTIYQRSHGFADVAAGRAADERTLWYVASTSKSFTGFAVALLAHAGELAMDAPITTLLPQARWHPAARPDQLTLAHFLSHTHHLNDNAVVQSAAFTGAIPEARWPALVALAEPSGSSDLVYSNFGYNVAAMVIDARRPEGWKRYLEEHVYRPAGLRETYARVSGLEARIARPHRLRADGRFETEPFFKTDATMNSAGGHVATLGDLARWTIVQMDSGVIDGRRVFPAEAVALSHRLIARQTRDQAKRFAYFDREGWGAGWDLGTYEGERMVSRFGGYHGTRSHLSFLPARRIGVVAATTGGLGSAVTDLLAALVYDLEAGRADARQRAEQRFAELVTRLGDARRGIAAFDSVRARRQQPLGRPLADFTGVYEQPDYGRFELRERDGRLEFRWGALYGPAEVYDAAKAQLRVELAGSGQVVTFGLPERGPAERLEIGGVTFVREGAGPR
jgi:CubicO group peptidase (beta-lactamase class C family)